MFYNYNDGYPHGGKGMPTENVLDFEALQKARKDIIGEFEAIMQYDDHAKTTNLEIAKTSWKSIRDEELVHVGELMGLIFMLAPYQKELIEKGFMEFEERMKKENR